MQTRQYAVKHYDEFLEALNELGFILFGGRASGMLTLGDITAPGDWFCGEPETNPWEWRNLLCERRDGVYARMLGGQTFMVSSAWYPRFLAAYRECDSLPERYEAGLVSADVFEMYRMFEEKPFMGKHELTARFTRPRAEKALTVLQREMYITISGEVQKLSVDFKPIGWPSMEYARVDVWAADALSESEKLDCGQARREIRRRAGEISPGADEKALHKLFGA